MVDYICGKWLNFRVYDRYLRITAMHKVNQYQIKLKESRKNNIILLNDVLSTRIISTNVDINTLIYSINLSHLFGDMILIEIFIDINDIIF